MSIRSLSKAFGHNSRPDNKNDELHAIVRRVQELSGEAIIEIGRQFLRAKEILPHGEFTPWLKANFEFSSRTAQRYMTIAEYADKCDTVSGLSPGVAYILAASSTPDVVRDHALAKLNEGQKLTKKLLERLKQEYRDECESPARKLQQDATRKIASATAIAAPPSSPSKSLFRLPQNIKSVIKNHEVPADKNTFWIKVRREEDRLRVLRLAAHLPHQRQDRS